MTEGLPYKPDEVIEGGKIKAEPGVEEGRELPRVGALAEENYRNGFWRKFVSSAEIALLGSDTMVKSDANQTGTLAMSKEIYKRAYDSADASVLSEKERKIFARKAEDDFLRAQGINRNYIPDF